MDETIRLCREAMAMLGDDGDLTQWTMLHTAALRDAVAVFAAERTDGERYRWLRDHWARVVTDTSCGGVDEPRRVKTIEVGSALLGSVDTVSLDAAIDRAMRIAP